MVAPGSADVAEGAETRYRDPVSGCDVLVTTPRARPALWRDYLAGALRSYRSYGVEHALDYAQMCDGRSSSLLFAVLDEHGKVIGGIRSQGPYTSAEQTHALHEWAGDPGQPALRAALEQMIPEGLVELKAAWVADDTAVRRQLVACLSRTPAHAATVLHTRYAMGTAAAHAVPGWAAAGGIVAADVPAVPYPDERYRTRLVYWDREHLVEHLSESERAHMAEETAQLTAGLLPRQVKRRLTAPSVPARTPAAAPGGQVPAPTVPPIENAR